MEEFIAEAALSNSQGALHMRFPAALSRALIKSGYTRVAIFATEEGLLFKPYVGESTKKSVQLPKWSDE